MDRSKLIAIVTGVLSLILGIAYLAIVQFLDSRDMIPAPIGQLPVLSLLHLIANHPGTTFPVGFLS
ncbi:MAG: hypothetical protein SFW36_11835 [Leptolyngbyaceae cyanobacterium bins.59]|nr:hypothetical protein [Leptolyngbyaceae cyanobacterium bins.59]